MTVTIDFESKEWNVAEWIENIGGQKVDLQPDFQRYYVWDDKKEKGFIDSLMRGYAVPPVWIWERDSNDIRTYSVIDGQQRLTCIKRYYENKFFYKETTGSEVSSAVCKSADGRYYNKDEKQTGSNGVLDDETRKSFRRSKIPLVIVRTDSRAAVIEIFQRLNQSSMNLNGQELRNAIFRGEFKKSIYQFVKEMRQKGGFWVTGQRAFDLGKKADRMDVEKHVGEMYAAIIFSEESPLNKSDRLDYCYKQYDDVFIEREKVEKTLKEALKDIRETLQSSSKFCRNISELYTLVGIYTKTHKKLKRKLNTTERKLVRENLDIFQTRYSEWESNYKKAKTDRSKLKIEESAPVFKQYRETLQGPIHEKATRSRRETILGELITPLLGDKSETPAKDPRRNFSQCIRDIVWHQASGGDTFAPCANPQCQKQVAREECEFDHINAWSKGGASDISNCQVLCKLCNRSKGDS